MVVWLGWGQFSMYYMCVCSAVPAVLHGGVAGLGAVLHVLHVCVQCRSCCATWWCGWAGGSSPCTTCVCAVPFLLCYMVVWLGWGQFSMYYMCVCSAVPAVLHG